jgi:hypothetical protein
MHPLKAFALANVSDFAFLKAASSQTHRANANVLTRREQLVYN